MIPRESNDKLCDFARFWTLDGDYLRCKACKRPLIASRDGEALLHAAGCKNADRLHPWTELRALIAPDGVLGTPAHSKSEYKRRVAQGDPSVLPPSGVAPTQEGEQ